MERPERLGGQRAGVRGRLRVDAAKTSGSGRRPWGSILLRGLPQLAAVALASQYLVEDFLPGSCDENVIPGTELADGCYFLQDGGYTMVRLLPAAIVVGFILLAARRRRVGLVHAGFALALLLLVLALALTPEEYPV